MKFTVPNQLTLFRILLTPLFYILIISDCADCFLWAAVVYTLAAITDWYDGYFARRLGMVTRWGQFMDPLADKVLIATALLVFAQLNYIFWWMVIIILARDFIVTSLRMFALYFGNPVVTTIVAKWKTFLQMAFVFALLIYINIPGLQDIKLNHTEHPWFLWTTITVSIILILTVYSGIYYLVVNRLHVLELGRVLWNILRRRRR